MVKERERVRDLHNNELIIAVIINRTDQTSLLLQPAENTEEMRALLFFKIQQPKRHFNRQVGKQSTHFDIKP
jgi:hypothetical protein